jgi:hypothetical protein
MSYIFGTIFAFIVDGESKKPDLNNYSWIIITAMAGFILTLGGVIAKLYKDLQKCQEDRKQFTEAQLALLRTLRNEFDKDKEGGR